MPAASKKSPSAPATPAKSRRTSRRQSHKTPRSKSSKRQKVYYVIFVLAWAAFALIASQYLIAFPMSWLLGSAVTEPFWTLIYYILYNGLSLALVLFVPPKLLQLYRRNHPATNTAPDAPEPASSSAAPEDQATQLVSTSPRELGIMNWPTFVDIGLAPIAYTAYILVANIITNIFSAFPWFDAHQEQNVGFNGYFITTGDRVCAMLAIVFIAPIVEEIIMRGWVYGKLRSKLKIPLAIILTSALFAILHGQLNVGVTVFVLSCVLCGLREVTGTIWSGMLLHILSNGIAFYILYIAAPI